MLGGCSNQSLNFEGVPLKIAVIGETPEISKDKKTFENVDLEEFSAMDLGSASEFNAVMVTPSMHEEASDDRFVEVYRNSKVPIIFFDSPKRHLPFVNDNVTHRTTQVVGDAFTSKYSIYLGISLSGGVLFSLYFLPINLKVARYIAVERNSSILHSFLRIEVGWVFAIALIWLLCLVFLFH